jgi:hypothetical protein
MARQNGRKSADRETCCIPRSCRKRSAIGNARQKRAHLRWALGVIEGRAGLSAPPNRPRSLWSRWITKSACERWKGSWAMVTNLERRLSRLEESHGSEPPSVHWVKGETQAEIDLPSGEADYLRAGEGHRPVRSLAGLGGGSWFQAMVADWIGSKSMLPVIDLIGDTQAELDAQTNEMFASGAAKPADGFIRHLIVDLLGADAFRFAGERLMGHPRSFVIFPWEDRLLTADDQPRLRVLCLAVR